MQRRRCRLAAAMGRHHGCDGVLKLLLGHGLLSVFRQDHTCRQIRAPSPNPSRPALPVTRVLAALTPTGFPGMMSRSGGKQGTP